MRRATDLLLRRLRCRRLGVAGGREVVRQLELGSLYQAEVGDEPLAGDELVKLRAGVVELHLLVPGLLVLQVQVGDVPRPVLAERELDRRLLRLQ